MMPRRQHQLHHPARAEGRVRHGAGTVCYSCHQRTRRPRVNPTTPTVSPDPVPTRTVHHHGETYRFYRHDTNRISDWPLYAICGDADPDLFLSSSPVEARREGARICVACPVRLECLSDAWGQNNVGMIRGGFEFLTPGHGTPILLSLETT